MYICDFSRSVGAGSATTRKTRGLTRSVMALMVPPLPAPSRPSKTMQILAPVAWVHCCSLTNSTWSPNSASSYALRGSLAPLLEAAPALAPSGPASGAAPEGQASGGQAPFLPDLCFLDIGGSVETCSL